MKLVNTLYEIVDKKPNCVALSVKEKMFTYANIKERINMWKRKLVDCGVSRRSKVVVYMKETIDIVGTYFALCELDCVIIPVDISTKKSNIPDITKSGKAHFVISYQALRLDGSQQLKLPELGYVLYRTLYEDKDVPNNIMQFIYTSGTTGMPKCVMFSKENMTNNIIGLAETLLLSENDVIYTPISLMLPAALNTVLLPALLSGAKVIVSESTVPGSVLRNIINQGVTVFFAVPFYYKLLTNSRLCTEDVWKNVRLCLTSSAYLDEEDFNNFYYKTKRGLHSIYCSSEAGTIAYNSSEDIDILRKFVGRPLDACEVSLINVNAEGVGEIVAKGGMVSRKYYENEELNKEVYKNGWVRTGDIGFIHKNGYIEIRGRISETINIAGHLVNPSEVERVILNIKAIKDVVAYKYINVENNNMLGVKVIVNKGDSTSKKEIIEYCETVLPNYKIPKSVQFVDYIDTGRYGKKKRNI